jgi:hypothetical protein
MMKQAKTEAYCLNKRVGYDSAGNQTIGVNEDSALLVENCSTESNLLGLSSRFTHVSGPDNSKAGDDDTSTDRLGLISKL